MSYYLSFLMGASNISDDDLIILGLEIKDKDSDGDYSLTIPSDKLPGFIELVKAKLTPGFWNEIVGVDKIIFIFKFQNGTIKEFTLSLNNEKEIDKLCAEFNSGTPEEVANVYEWISNNKFYHDFMIEHYSDLIKRQIL